MRALLIFLLLLTAVGCGQKGALIEPEDPPTPVAAQADDEDEDDEADAKARRRDQP